MREHIAKELIRLARELTASPWIETAKDDANKLVGEIGRILKRSRMRDAEREWRNASYFLSTGIKGLSASGSAATRAKGDLEKGKVFLRKTINNIPKSTWKGNKNLQDKFSSLNGYIGALIDKA